MAYMYCKLFASLYQGTLRGKSHEILVFTNMLAHADQDGCVDKHFRAIADEVGLTVEEVKRAIEVLESPDPESRSPEKEGRRIERINDHRAWGWKIVNYGKYRSIKSDEDRRKANREAQARWREKQKGKNNITVTDSNGCVMPSNALSCESAQGEGEGYGEEEAEAEEKAPRKVKPSKLNSPLFDSSDSDEFKSAMADWFQYKLERNERYTEDGWKRILAQQHRFAPHFVKASVDASIRNGWKGLFTEKNDASDAQFYLPKPITKEIQAEEDMENPMARLFANGRAREQAALEPPKDESPTDIEPLAEGELF